MVLQKNPSMGGASDQVVLIPVAQGSRVACNSETYSNSGKCYRDPSTGSCKPSCRATSKVIEGLAAKSLLAARIFYIGLY